MQYFTVEDTDTFSRIVIVCCKGLILKRFKHSSVRKVGHRKYMRGYYIINTIIEHLSACNIKINK